TGLPLVQLGLALAMQGDARRGDAAIADGFALDPGRRPRWIGDYGSVIRDDALMVALLHERDRASPAYDARAMDVARALQSRRAADGSGRLWLSTQEQMAIARLGRALQAGDGRQVTGQWHDGPGDGEAVTGALFAQRLDAAALAAGARFQAKGGPYYA